tara:strand:+ start:1581 stop:2246 length:666 start_codon:yes stop_codon:yes gene_type:complete
MTQEQEVRKLLQVEVISAAPDTSKRDTDSKGNPLPQWRLEVKYPFSKFAAKAWIKRDPATTALPPGTYWCEVLRGSLREGKDADAEFNFNWHITKFNAPAPDGSAPAQRPQAGAQNGSSAPQEPSNWHEETMKADHLSKRLDIKRSVALERATEIEIARRMAGDVPAIDREAIRDDARWFYENWLALDLLHQLEDQDDPHDRQAGESGGPPEPVEELDVPW